MPYCDCGKWHSEEFERCYDCNLSQAVEDGRVCECGNFKKAEYPTCYECFQEKEDNGYEEPEAPLGPGEDGWYET